METYQLNSSELAELDVVRNAHSIMDEALLTESKGAKVVSKGEHNAIDILNIMDITMRRLVRMTKKLPSFQTMSNKTKLDLLRGKSFFNDKKFWGII